MTVTPTSGPSTTTDYVCDGQSMVQELQGGQVTATYLQGLRGPECRIDESTGQTRWYLYDGLGSVLGEVDEQGNVTGTRKHDVYGLSRGTTGTNTSKHGFVGSLGHSSDDETGLIYMRARYYDPQVGRFASEDPAKDGRNWFAYCAANPVNCVDSSGCVIEVLCTSVEDAIEKLDELAQGSTIKGKALDLASVQDKTNRG